MNWIWLDQRPVVVAIAGPNGAGKSTFFEAFIAPAGLRLVNADRLAAELGLDALAAAAVADRLRRELIAARESFAFETVFSDPVGDKLRFLEECASAGYTTVLLFVGLASARDSIERVAMRVSQGGHDVPRNKLLNRFPRIQSNLKAAIQRLPHVIVFDNSDLAAPFRQLAAFDQGQVADRVKLLPRWLRKLL